MTPTPAPSAPWQGGRGHTEPAYRTGSRPPTGTEVGRVIQTGLFAVVYQPIVDITLLNAGRPEGYEALSRFSIGSPAQWFATASRTGLRIELELAAIRLAIAGFPAADTNAFLALNASIETLCSPLLFASLEGIAPERIVLEVPEDTFIADYDGIRFHIDRLLGRGYRLAMDDLARGRVDLWHLVRLRPSIIKLDLSMVRDIDIDPSKQSLVNGLRLLGDVLRAQVVAEGIERQGELDLLQQLGVHLGQGHFLGRPGPIGGPPVDPRAIDTGSGGAGRGLSPAWGAVGPRLAPGP